MASHLLFPGTFDPPTLGHVDLVRRALELFDRVTVGLAEHPSKQALFTAKERAELFEACTHGWEGVEVVVIDGLVVQACEAHGCDAILRGVRSGSEFDYEARMAITNRRLQPGFETVLLVTSPELVHVTSTVVRQIAAMQGDVGHLVPEPVNEALLRRFRG